MILILIKSCYYRRFHTCGNPVTLNIEGSVEIRSNCYSAPEEALNRVSMNLHINKTLPNQAFGFAFSAEGKQFKQDLADMKDV